MGFMSWMKGLGKADKIVDTGLDLIQSGAKGLDAMFYTDEEKAQDKAKNAATIINHAVQMNKLINEGKTASSQTRRILAFAIAGVALCTYLWCVVILSYAYFFSNTEGVIGKAKAFVGDVIATSNALYVGGAFTAVVILFFGYYGLNKVIKK